MQITDVRIRLEHPTGKIKATARVTFNEDYIAMPSRRRSDGSYKDITHPINPETRAKIQDAIFEKYEQKMLEEESALTEISVPSIDSIEESA